MPYYIKNLEAETNKIPLTSACIVDGHCYGQDRFLQVGIEVYITHS